LLKRSLRAADPWAVTETVKWRTLDRDRRRRVARAVRKGLAVGDPRDAPYAVGFVDASLEWLSWNRRFRPLHLLLVTLVIAELTLTGDWRPALLLYPLVAFTFLRLRAPGLRRRLEAARAVNAGLVSQFGLDPVRVEMPGRAFFAPGSRLRRRFMRSLVVALVLLVALTVAATVWAIGQNHRWTAAANRVCAREQARIAALSARSFGPLRLQERANIVEEDALTELERLHARTPLQKNFVAWREYEVKLDVWLLGRLELDDRPAVAIARHRIESARAYSRTLARRIGAEICARP
jgi:hypothetical protein